MMSEFCLDVNSVSIQIGQDLDGSDIRICLPYLNVGIENGNEVPLTWPPEVLRNAADGSPLLTPDGGSLLIAG